MKIAITGSFDPITKGHEWLIKEALRISSNVCVIIGYNPAKQGLVPIEDRKKLIEQITNLKTYVCEQEFLVEYCEEIGVTHLLRGIRNAQDMEYEKVITLMNHKINPKIQTLLVQPPEDLGVISSSLVRSFVGLKNWEEHVAPVVSPIVLDYLNIEYWKKSGLFPSYVTNPEKEKIIKKMMEPQRAYHTLQHWGELYSLSQQIPALKNLVDTAQLESVHLAIIFHDIVYDPQSKTNEEDSAKLFEKFAEIHNLPPNQVKFVVEMILATKNHLKVPDSLGYIGKIFLDMDMSILANKNPLRIKSYEFQIREEYGVYLDEIYYPNRIKFLESLVGKKIFNSGVLDSQEPTAQKNLQELIKDLKKHG